MKYAKILKLPGMEVNTNKYPIRLPQSFELRKLLEVI